MKKTRRHKKNILAKKIKSYQKIKFDIDDYIERNYDKDGNFVIVDIECKNKNDIFSSFSSQRQKFLSTTFLTELESFVEPIPKIYDIRLQINTNNLTKDDIDLIKQEVSDHYAMKLHLNYMERVKNNYKIIGLTVLGFILLVGYFVLELWTQTRFFTEFLSIAGTFALWEVADFGFLEKNALKLECLHLGQLSHMEIDIINITE